MKNIISCFVCGKELTGKQTRFCSSSCKNSINQSYSAQQARGLKRKKEIVRKLGRQYSLCKYSKNLSALVFHHVDPSKKSFELDLRSLSNRRYAQIEKELNKCILICSNCHAETHYPQHNLE